MTRVRGTRGSLDLAGRLEEKFKESLRDRACVYWQIHRKRKDKETHLRASTFCTIERDGKIAYSYHISWYSVKVQKEREREGSEKDRISVDKSYTRRQH